MPTTSTHGPGGNPRSTMLANAPSQPLSSVLSDGASPAVSMREHGDAVQTYRTGSARIRISLGGVQQGGQGHVDVVALNERLAATVPPTARTVLQVGHGPRLDRRAVEAAPAGAPSCTASIGSSPAGPRPPGDLDGYFELDLDRDLPPLAPGSVDCIVYAEVLPRLADPLAVLKQHRALLSLSGSISCSVPNLQHHRASQGSFGESSPTTAGTLLDGHLPASSPPPASWSCSWTRGSAPDTVWRGSRTSARSLWRARGSAVRAPRCGRKRRGARSPDHDADRPRVAAAGRRRLPRGPHHVRGMCQR